MTYDKYIIDEMIEDARSAILVCNSRPSSEGVSGCVGCPQQKSCESQFNDDLLIVLHKLSSIARDRD